VLWRVAVKKLLALCWLFAVPVIMMYDAAWIGGRALVQYHRDGVVDVSERPGAAGNRWKRHLKTYGWRLTRMDDS